MYHHHHHHHHRHHHHHHRHHCVPYTKPVKLMRGLRFLLQERDAVQPGRCLPAFRMSTRLPSSSQNIVFFSPYYCLHVQLKYEKEDTISRCLRQTVFPGWYSGVVGSNPTQAWMSVCVYFVFMLNCV
jgi:hypothetical protein